MVSDTFPCTTKVAVFPTSSGVLLSTCNSANSNALPKNCETPPLLARTPPKITSHVHCLSCLLANSNNVMYPAALVHIHVTANLAVCAVPE